MDLSNNRVDHEDVEAFLQVLEQMASLGVLYLTGNPIVKKIPNYRKTLVTRLKALKYLDDRPVFPEDRRFAEAWLAGGNEGERAERQRFKEEEDRKRMEEHLAFGEMIAGFRREREQRDLEARTGQEGSDAESDGKPLDTYYSSDRAGSEREESSSLDPSKPGLDSQSLEDSKSKSETSSVDGSREEEEARPGQSIDKPLKQLDEVKVEFADYMTELD